MEQFFTDRFDIQVKNGTYTLEVNDLSEADAGQYTFEATNALGMVSCSCTLDVIGTTLCTFTFPFGCAKVVA